MVMAENKKKRFDYLRQNINLLNDKEYQEYQELLQEFGYIRENDFMQDEQYTNHEPQSSFDRSNSQPFENSRQAQSMQQNSSRKSSKNLRNADVLDSEDTSESKKGKKKKKKSKWRFFRRGILLVLVLFIAGIIGSYFYGYNRGIKVVGTPAKSETFNGTSNADGSVNILILGADQRPGQSSSVAHSDSIMVLNVNNKTHETHMVSFMRDTLVSIPGVSDNQDVKINAAYTIGEQNNGQGAELMRETLQQNFGINCKYYAVLDFETFATVIDSLYPWGVEIDAQFSTINGQTVSEVPVPDDMAATAGVTSTDRSLTADQAAQLGYPDGGGTFMMIKQGKQRMNGRTLLNYSRFRHDDMSDFGRVQRQQQVMKAIMSGVKNPLIPFTGASALGTAKAVMSTNIPDSFLWTNGLGIALNAGKIQSSSVPALNDYTPATDIYGGAGLSIDMNKYKAQVQQTLGQ